MQGLKCLSILGVKFNETHLDVGAQITKSLHCGSQVHRCSTGAECMLRWTLADAGMRVPIRRRMNDNPSVTGTFQPQACISAGIYCTQGL